MTMRREGTFAAVFLAAMSVYAGVLDNAWIKGTTNKSPIDYKPGEEMVFTLETVGVQGSVPEGEYSLWWQRSDDYGNFVEGKVSFTGKPFVYKTSLDKPGFVRFVAYVLSSRICTRLR